MTESVSRPRRQAAFGFIFASALMNSISFGLMIPILPNLIRQLAGGDTAAASDWNVAFATVWGLMQFIIGPILGMMSDRFGRRPILLISSFGLAVDFLVMAFAPTLWWLFVGRVLNGLTAASFSTGGAYVADITPPEQRARNFGMLTSAFSMGFLVGPSLGGFLGDISIRLPFLVAAGLTALNWLYGLLILPESLPPERRLARFDWTRANPLGSLRLLLSHPGLLSVRTLHDVALSLVHVGVGPDVFGHRRHGRDRPDVSCGPRGVEVRRAQAGVDRMRRRRPGVRLVWGCRDRMDVPHGRTNIRLFRLPDAGGSGADVATRAAEPTRPTAGRQPEPAGRGRHHRPVDLRPKFRDFGPA